VLLRQLPLSETTAIDADRNERIELGVDYGLTVSCYQADDAGRACGVCDSCRPRAEGFRTAYVAAPTRYC
jgi:7-cyano-7-deazaguanine synthase